MKTKSIFFNAVFIVTAMLLAGNCGSSSGNSEDSGDSGDSGGGGNTGIVIPNNIYGPSTNVVPAGLTVDFEGDSNSCIDYSSPDCTAFYDCMNDCMDNHPDDVTCFLDCDRGDCYIHGGYFGISVNVTNTTASSITYVIAAGTLYVSDSDSVQPMIVIITITIIIEAYETRNVCIPVFCLDSHSSLPDSSNEYFDTGNFNSGCLSEIITILKNHNVDIEDLSPDDLEKIQEIIWDCTTEGDSIDPDDWEWLNSL